MQARDRRLTLALVVMAAASWLVVAAVLLTQDPRADPGIRYLGAAVLGLALAVTCAPLFWLASFVRQQRISFRGDWLRAARRGAWVGGVAGLIVLLRLEGLFQAQLALFVIALAVVAEVSLSTRR